MVLQIISDSDAEAESFGAKPLPNRNMSSSETRSCFGTGESSSALVSVFGNDP